MKTTITPYKDGPYLIRGEFQLVDREGQAIPVSRRTVALCRCGKSRLRPFCDGTHKLIGFRAPAGTDDALALAGDDRDEAHRDERGAS